MRRGFADNFLFVEFAFILIAIAICLPLVNSFSHHVSRPLGKGLKVALLLLILVPFVRDWWERRCWREEQDSRKDEKQDAP